MFAIDKLGRAKEKYHSSTGERKKNYQRFNRLQLIPGGYDSESIQVSRDTSQNMPQFNGNAVFVAKAKLNLH